MADPIIGIISVGDGATFTPHIASNGDLTWTNNKNLPNPGSVNIKGPKGDQGLTGPTGPQGPQGAEGPAGQDGNVEFSDLTEDQKEQLVGPRYVKDEQGYLCIDYGSNWFED